MGNFTRYAENKLQDHVFGKGVYTRPANLFFGLCQSDPGETATGGALVEPTGSNYARINTGAWDSAASRATANTTVRAFTAATTAWGKLTHFVVVDTSVLATGNVIAHGGLAAIKNIGTGVTARIIKGDCNVSIDMGGMSNYLANKVLDHVFEGTAYTPPTSIFGALCTDAIIDADTGTTITEPSGAGSGYARRQIAQASLTTSVAGLISVRSDVAFAPADGPWGTVGYFALVDGATLGNVLFHSLLDTAWSPYAGDVVVFQGDRGLLLDATLEESTVVEGGELITNGDFSSWTGAADPDNLPTGWFTYGARSAGNLTSDATNAMRIQKSTTGLLGVAKSSVVTRYKTYIGSMRLVSGDYARMWMGTFDDGILVDCTTVARVYGGVKRATIASHTLYITTNQYEVVTPLDVTVTDVSYKEYYLFDGGPNARHLSPANQPVWNTLASGLKVMNFNGTTDLLDTGADDIGTGDVTVEAWIRPESTGETGTSHIVTNSKFTFYMNANGDKLSFSSDLVTFINSGTDISMNTWHHALITVTSAGVANFYINGVLSGSADQNSGTRTAGTTNVFIGNRSVADRTFDGDISRVRIYSGIKSTDFIKYRFNKHCEDYGKAKLSPATGSYDTPSIKIQMD